MIYDLFLTGLFLVISPKTLKNSAKRRHLWKRFSLPKKTFSEKPIWIHGVSLGEIHAAKSLIQAIKKKYPNTPLIVSSSTNTGAEALKKLQNIDGHFVLPFDFSFLIKRLFLRLQPKTLILIEGDYWKNLLHYAKKNQCKIFLVSAKMSDRSYKRLSYLPFVGKRLFSNFSGIFVQNAEHYQKFSPFFSQPSLKISGNIKFSNKLSALSKKEILSWKKKFFIGAKDFTLSFGSTHEGEEKHILDQLERLWDFYPNTKVFLVPRHPERFDQVARLLEEKKISYARYSKKDFSEKNRLILIDTMGFLPICYALSDAAVVCGSYVSHVGGHNILEPNFLSVPVFFGPYMASQKEMQSLVEDAQSGAFLPMDKLGEFFCQFFSDPSLQKNYRDAAKKLTHSLDANLEKTLASLEKFQAF